MRINEKEKDGGSVEITVTRSLETQNLIEIYSDYVAKKIREIVHLGGTKE